MNRTLVRTVGCRPKSEHSVTDRLIADLDTGHLIIVLKNAGSASITYEQMIATQPLYIRPRPTPSTCRSDPMVVIRSKCIATVICLSATSQHRNLRGEACRSPAVALKHRGTMPTIRRFDPRDQSVGASIGAGCQRQESGSGDGTFQHVCRVTGVRLPSMSASAPDVDIRRIRPGIDEASVFCEDMKVERVKQIISKDGRHRLDVKVSPSGLYRFVSFDDRYRNDPDFQSPPEWTIDEISGLYESMEAVEADATAKLAWLRE